MVINDAAVDSRALDRLLKVPGRVSVKLQTELRYLIFNLAKDNVLVRF